MHRLIVSVLLAIAVASAGCGGDGAPAQDTLAASLVDSYDCGYGFYLGTADQTAGLFLVFTDFETALAGGTPELSRLPDDDWVAEVQIGRNLFTSWCDDSTPEPGQEPTATEVWPVISGTVAILEMPAPGVCGRATARLEGLEVQRADGTPLVLGDFEVVNRAFGCVAG